MRGSVLLLVLVVAVCAMGMRHGPRAAGKMAASPAAAADLDAFEQLLVDKPDPARLREALFSLTRYPHVFGVANVVPQITAQMGASLQAFGNNGSSVSVEPFTALSTLPLTRVVMLQANASETPVSLDLTEGCVPEDPTSCLSSITPLWGGYSPPTPNGEPTPYAPVVYANYCREEDYAYLEARGISVKDNIVLCRYGAIFRAQKAQFAEARGARGVLVYSDPIDDGYWAADQYPNGPARPPSGGQRGTYCYGQLCPGDPDPNRTMAVCGVNILPHIPIQPISWSAALPILQALGGEPVVTYDGWQGGLPLHYHMGPGPATVSMQLTVDSARRQGFNVISKIEGGDLAHEIVAVGCHMDAWVMGASDPLSGQAVMIELARVMGLMHAAGWSPRRSIHFLAWDGEEYNLLGSTDYVDKKGDMITKRMVAYVNIDGIVGNWFPDKVALSLSASPVLADVFLDAVSKTPSPVNASQMVSSVFDGTFSVLGDGSDYCSFINHLGVASLDINWGSPNLPSPQYHSRYDSFFLMNNITDPQFAVHKSSVTLVGLIMYHLSTDAALHLSPSFAAAQYASYKTSIVAQFPILSRLDWAGFDSAVAEFNVAASAAQALVNSSDPAVNSVLWTLDRQFLTESGLPGRKYFRHVMQAPDLLNDYNSQVLPGVAYYAAANDLPNAQVQLKVVEELLTKAGQGITAVVPVSNAVTIAVIVVAVAFFVAIVIIVILYLRRRSLAHRRYTELPEHK